MCRHVRKVAWILALSFFAGCQGCPPPQSKKAVITPNPTVCPFGSQDVGTTSARLHFTITNSGNLPGNGTLVLAGSNADQFSIVSGGGYALAPGASQQVSVTFHPTSAGAKSATITVDSTPVTLTGTGVTCIITPNVTSHAFGSQNVGTTSGSWCFTITNNGTAACSGTLALSETNPDQFSIVSGASYNLAAGGAQQVCVTFHPTSAGAKSATIVVGSTTVTLTGTVDSVCVLVPHPTSNDFGSQTVGTTSGSWCFTITAMGTATCSGTLPLAGSNADQFSIVSGGSYTLAPGASQQVCVTFHPTSAGAKSATITVGSTPVTLTGTGATCIIAPNATSNDFGLQTVTTTSGNWCFTITNNGTATCSGTLALAGSNADQFSIVSGASYNLTAGASQQVCVTFHPTSAGAKSATITVGSTPVTLTGTGVGRCACGGQSEPDGTAFNNVCTGASSAAKGFVVSNSGSAACLFSASSDNLAFLVSPPSQTINPGDSGTFNVTFSPTSTGAQSANISIQSAAGCGYSTQFSGTGVTVPSVSIGNCPNSPSHVGDAVVFTGNVTSTTSVLAYSWDFGDGTTSSQQSPTHTYSFGGQYTVTFQAQNACGSSLPTTCPVSVAEQAYVDLVTLSCSPTFSTNIDQLAGNGFVTLYRGTNASVTSVTGAGSSCMTCGLVWTSGASLGANVAIGQSGQSFSTASLPGPGTYCRPSLYIDSENAGWGVQTPNAYLKLGPCAHILLGAVANNCLGSISGTTGDCPSGGSRVELGVDGTPLGGKYLVRRIKLLFTTWWVVPTKPETTVYPLGVSSAPANTPN